MQMEGIGLGYRESENYERNNDLRSGRLVKEKERKKRKKLKRESESIIK